MGLFDTSPERLAQTGAVLVAGSLALSPPFWLVARRVFPGRNVFFARWGFLDVARVVLSGIVAFWLLPRVLPTFGSPIVWAITNTMLGMGVMSLLCVRIASRTEPSGIHSIGFRPDRIGSSLLTGLVLYIAALPGVLGLVLTSPWFVSLNGATWEVQFLLEQGIELQGAEFLFLATCVVLIGPLFEEILFRGFLQPLLVQNLREPGGIALTSLIFAALHGQSAFLSVFGLSLVLGAVKLRTQRLWATWFVHALHNGLVLGVARTWPELLT